MFSGGAEWNEWDDVGGADSRKVVKESFAIEHNERKSALDGGGKSKNPPQVNGTETSKET